MSEEPRMWERWRGLPVPVQAAALGAGYLAAAALSAALTRQGGEVVGFWPGAGLALLALLVSERSAWPAQLGAVAVASVAFNALDWEPLDANAAFALANTAGPLAGALASQALLGRRRLDLSQIGDFAAMVWAVVATAVVSGAVGAAAAVPLMGGANFETWLAVVLGTATGAVLVLPFGLGLAHREDRPVMLGRLREAVATWVLATVLSFLVFGLTEAPLFGVALAPVLWASLRLGMCASSLTMTLVAVTVLGFTARGEGMYAAAADDRFEAILVAQTTLILASLACTAIAAVTVERTLTRDRLRDQEEALRTARRVESLGTVASAVAHDFNNVLAVIRGHTELATRSIALGQDAAPELRRIARGVESGQAMVRQLLAFSRDGPPRPQPVSVNAVAADVQALLGRVLAPALELRLDLDASAGDVLADHTQLEHALLNLVMNARDAMPGGGQVTLRSCRRGGEVLLEVDDTGIGMDAETRDRVVESGFSTKPGGTGLGLSTARTICEQHRGRLTIDSEPGRGTTVSMAFPRLVPAAAPVMPADRVLASGAETVLLAEDNEHVRALMRAALSESGYRLLEASDGGEALGVAAAHEGPIDLLVTDITMPSLDGPSLYRRLREDRPGLRALFVSGAAEEAATTYGLDEELLLGKPFGLVELAGRVRAVLDRPVRT